MLKKKFNKEDIAELRKREELINAHLLTAQALQMEKQQFLLGKYPKYQLDPHKQYSIDLKTGRITEVKQ